MKAAIRVFAFGLVLAGAAAASLGSSSSRVFASHQSATAGLPIPTCGPNVPLCNGR